MKWRIEKRLVVAAALLTSMSATGVVSAASTDSSSVWWHGGIRPLVEDTDGDGVPNVDDRDDDNDGIADRYDPDPLFPNRPGLPNGEPFSPKDFLWSTIVVDGYALHGDPNSEIGPPDFDQDEFGFSVKAATGIDFAGGSSSPGPDLGGEKSLIATGEWTGVIQIRTEFDMLQAINERKFGLIHTAHGHPPLNGVVGDKVETWYENGLRVLHFCHWIKPYQAPDEKLGGANTEDGDSFGLTSLGDEVLSEMIRLRMVVDVAHCSETTTLQIADRLSPYGLPFIASHAPIRALHYWPDAKRGKTDREIEAIAASGGVVGVMLVPGWLRITAHPSSIDDYHAHLRHVIDLVGIDHVGVASDSFLKGSSSWVGQSVGLNGRERFRTLVQYLHDQGYNNEELQKIMGLNFIRAYRGVLGSP